MSRLGFLKKIFSPIPVVLSLIFLMLFLLVLREYNVLSLKIVRNSVSNSPQTPKKSVENISTSSAWYADQILSPTPAKSLSTNNSSIPKGKPGEMTVSCVVDSHCGGGEKVLPLSVCENSACCLVDGKYTQFWDRKSCNNSQPSSTETVSNTYVYPVYVEESHRQPINNYEPIYMREFGITYSCLSTKHAEILQAQQAYEKTKEDIAKLCANNDTTTYAFCVEGCSSENYKACEQECYSKIDWTCSVNPTYSPEYRNLEHLMGMYCK